VNLKVTAKAMSLNRFSVKLSICVFEIAKHIRLNLVCMIVSSDARIKQYATWQDKN